MTSRFLLIAIAVATMMIAGCGKNVVAVDSGTYEGTIGEVNAAEEEIYVKIDGDQTLELYFTEETELTKDGRGVPFSELENGQQVSVEVKRVGNRVEPVKVNILE